MDKRTSSSEDSTNKESDCNEEQDRPPTPPDPEATLIYEKLKGMMENMHGHVIKYQQQKHELARMKQALRRIELEEHALKRQMAEMITRFVNDEMENDSVHENSVYLGSSSSAILPEEARLIAIIAIFLKFQRFGAKIDNIRSYLQEQMNTCIGSRDIENLLKRFPTIFREDSTGNWVMDLVL